MEGWWWPSNKDDSDGDDDDNVRACTCFSYLAAALIYAACVLAAVPRCIALFFNCGKFYPRGTITLIQRVVWAKPSDWSEMHSNCADNSQKAQPALMVGVPTLVGIISEIISNISCFSAVFHYRVYYFEEDFSLHLMFGFCCIHTSYMMQLDLQDVDGAVKRVCVRSETACRQSEQPPWPVFLCLSRICRESLRAGRLPKQRAILHQVSTDLWAVAQHNSSLLFI